MAGVGAAAVVMVAVAAALLPMPPLLLALAGVGVLLSAVLPTRLLVPVAYVAMSAVYLEAAVTGVYVGEISLGSRIARDGMLLTLAVVLAARSKVRHSLRRHVMVLAAVAGVSILARSPIGPPTLALLRYFALVPFVAMVAAAALRASVGTERGIRIMARALIFVACTSAVVGFLQVVGVLSTGFYEAYAAGGRSVGIVGQPNNQAFLLVFGVAALRHAAAFRTKTALVLAVLLSAGVFVTYSRSGIVALALVWLIPAARRRIHKRRVGRSLIAVGLTLLLAPTFFAARDNTAGILRNPRLEIVDRTLEELGIPGVLVGNPRLSTYEGASVTYVTDSAWLEAILLGGAPLALGWSWLLARVWRGGADLARALLLGFVVASITTAAFGLFPGVLFMWTLLFLTVPDGAAPFERVQWVRKSLDLDHSIRRDPSLSSASQPVASRVTPPATSES
ncbi:MAG TPA: hypothetical protein VGW38_22465 [Chloroflexota bacterium]|nr:hypothetical protein [Chloroflexota bacterium]